MGAYQEILGDLHNLFGDTHAVHVRLSKGKGFVLEQMETGDSVSEVLSYVHFEAQQLLDSVAQAADKAIQASAMTPDEKERFLAIYRDGLEGYTYFE